MTSGRKESLLEGSGIINRYVKEVKYILTNGATRPARALLIDDTNVILKYYREDIGKLVLFNEYFCYRLAKEIVLPMPQSGVCIINDKTVDNNNILKPESYGYAFYSTYISSTIFKQGIVKHLSNRDMFYRLLLFDHIIFNTDRNEFNLLTTFSKKDTSFSVIDHSHVFKNGTIWDANCFEYGIEEADFLSTAILESNEKMYGMFFQNMLFDQEMLLWEANRIRKIITSSLLDTIINDIPKEWLPSERDVLALKEYLLYRSDHILDMSKMIIKERR